MVLAVGKMGQSCYNGSYLEQIGDKTMTNLSLLQKYGVGGMKSLIGEKKAENRKREALAEKATKKYQRRLVFETLRAAGWSDADIREATQKEIDIHLGR